MDTLIFFSPAEFSTGSATTFSLELANTDSRWPGTTLVFERSGESSWNCVQGKEDKGWVSYVRASMEVRRRFTTQT